MTDALRMDYINSLPQPFMARFSGGDVWPIHDIGVNVPLCRIDVCGLLQVKQFSEIMEITDADGVKHNPDDWWVEAST